MPVFNLDSVQIYKHLNSLTSKPEFIEQLVEDGEIVSSSKADEVFDPNKYSNIRFTIYENIDGKLDRKELSNLEFADYLKIFVDSKNQIPDRVRDDKSVTNYLFDIKEPLESYSYFEFNQDLERIIRKFKIEDKIIAGGTIYYGYNYLFQLEEDSQPSLDQPIRNKELSLEELIDFLKEKDPESLNFLDLKNQRRLETAVNFIKTTNQKYSDNYYKSLNLRENFTLIILSPINREEYYSALDKIIDNRVNTKTQHELDFLIETYGGEVGTWLSAVSYEYKYFLEIHSQFSKNQLELTSPLSGESRETLQMLKYKEHQYAKRQMTFLRRLEKKLESTYVCHHNTSLLLPSS
jgi:tRNA A37 N6-isopentenylltransferase MiaA